MSTLFERWFAYGLGASIGKSLFGRSNKDSGRTEEPIRNQTEAEILADEKRFDEDEKRLDAEAAKK